MKNFIAVCICVFTLTACETEDLPKNTREPAQNVSPEKPVQAAQTGESAAPTESQVFSYILGKEYGLPSYMNMPSRIGEMLDLDAILQGVVDNDALAKDSSRELQISVEEQKRVDSYYAKVVEDRIAAGENAAPIVLAGPFKGGNVILADTTPMIIKYSYMQGVIMHTMFLGMSRNFGEEFDVHYFIRGIRESIFAEIDPSFRKSISKETLSRVNSLYVNRMEAIRKERRNALQ